VIRMRAVAEVQSEDIGAGAHECFDGGAVGARGAEGRDDLGVTKTLHFSCLQGKGHR
jgi:hypothetical protein